MIVICNDRSGKFSIIEDGENLTQTRNLKGVSEFLNEERPEEVEAHIFNGNSISFDLEAKDEEDLTTLIYNRFRKENDYHFNEE